MQTREDVRHMAERALREFIERPPQRAWGHAIRMTSGTSTAPLVCLQIMPEAGPRLYKKGAHNIIFAAGALNLRLGNLSLVRLAKAAQPMHVLSVGTRDLTPEITPLLDDFMADTLRGPASALVRLGQLVSSSAREKVSSVFTTGERLTMTMIQNLQEIFMHSKVSAPFYVLTETGLVGDATCGYVPPNHYHPAEGVLVEVAPDAGAGPGDILVSAESNGMRLKRYRTGDVGRFIDSSCACGAKQTFEICGRSGFDYIKISGAIFRQEELDRVLQRYRHAFVDYRAEVFEVIDGGLAKGGIVLRFYYPGEVTTSLIKEMSDEIPKRFFLTDKKTLENLTDEGVFLPLRVEFVDAPFARSSKEAAKISFRQ